MILLNWTARIRNARIYEHVLLIYRHKVLYIMYVEKAQAHNYFESARDIKLFASKSSDVVETTQLRGYVPGGCEFHESEIVILCIEVI